VHAVIVILFIDLVCPQKFMHSNIFGKVQSEILNLPKQLTKLFFEHFTFKIKISSL